MKAIAAALGRLVSFSLIVAMGAVAGVVSIPFISRVSGADMWAVQAFTQSLATLFGVAVAFGWGTVGPAMVASTPISERPRLFLESLISRLYLYVLTAPLMAATLVLLQPDNAGFVVLASATYLVPFLGASWFFIGEAKPLRLFAYDALPQVLGTVAGLMVLSATSELKYFVATQLVFNVFAVGLSTFAILYRAKGLDGVRWTAAAAFRRLSQQRHGVITAGTGALYVNLPLIVVNVFLPAHLDVYTFADRILRYAVTAFAPVLQFVQGWIPEAGIEHRRHRLKRAVQLTPVIGFCGSAAIALGSPLASELLLHGQTDLPFTLSVPFAVTFFAVAISQVIGLAGLVTVGESRELARSTVVGAVVGAPIILLGALFIGASGVAWAVAISEFAVASYQALVLRRYFSRTRNESFGAEHLS